MISLCHREREGARAAGPGRVGAIPFPTTLTLPPLFNSLPMGEG